MSGETANGWNQWSKYVLLTLESNASDHKEMIEMLQRMDKEIARLQVKSGLWGAVGGMLVTVGGVILWMISQS